MEHENNNKKLSNSKLASAKRLSIMSITRFFAPPSSFLLPLINDEPDSARRAPPLAHGWATAALELLPLALEVDGSAQSDQLDTPTETLRGVTAPRRLDPTGRCGSIVRGRRGQRNHGADDSRGVRCVPKGACEPPPVAVLPAFASSGTGNRGDPRSDPVALPPAGAPCLPGPHAGRRQGRWHTGRGYLARRIARQADGTVALELRGSPEALVRCGESCVSASLVRLLTAERHLQGFLTPTPLFYVRNHGVVPQVSLQEALDWTLEVSGYAPF
jgi:hypothetical protein